MSEQIVVSGKRVSGRLHIGHWWGAIRSWVQLQNEKQCYLGAMDWHGMTSEYKKPSEVSHFVRENIAEYIACGVDPEKSVIFVQSQVPETLELYMIFANLIPMGWLDRVPTWKDAEEELKQKEMHNLGRFAYPVLQAADICIYGGQLVPVGQDQVSHLELSREIVRRFNFLYKGKMPEPKPYLTDTPLILGIDGRKMSTSYGNGIYLVEESEKTLRKKVNMMLTDPQRARRENPGEPTVCPVYKTHKLYSSEEDITWVETGCRSAGIGCGDCKGRLADNIEKIMNPARAKKTELLSAGSNLDAIIQEGCEKARAQAQKTLRIVRSAMKWNS